MAGDVGRRASHCTPRPCAHHGALGGGRFKAAKSSAPVAGRRHGPAHKLLAQPGVGAARGEPGPHESARVPAGWECRRRKRRQATRRPGHRRCPIPRSWAGGWRCPAMWAAFQSVLPLRRLGAHRRSARRHPEHCGSRPGLGLRAWRKHRWPGWRFLRNCIRPGRRHIHTNTLTHSHIHTLARSRPSWRRRGVRPGRKIAGARRATLAPPHGTAPRRRARRREPRHRWPTREPRPHTRWRGPGAGMCDVRRLHRRALHVGDLRILIAPKASPPPLRSGELKRSSGKAPGRIENRRLRCRC